jgi:3-methyladenine DNA glycosylase AlkD
MGRRGEKKTPPEAEILIQRLEAHTQQKNRQGMTRFGINVSRALGVSMKTVRQEAKGYRRHHGTALELWKSEIHEARILATILGLPHKPAQWVAGDAIKELEDSKVVERVREKDRRRSQRGSRRKRRG